jgi:hypothetical protein
MATTGAPGLSASQLQARAQGRRRLAAMRRRAHRIRVWVSCVAVVAFLAMFATIYVQMARGDDPALNAGASHGASTSATTSQTLTSGSQSSAVTTDSSAAVAPVTTQQS